MKKQAIIALIFTSSLALTGCIEDLLSSLCNRLAGNDSVITYFENGQSFSNLKAVLTYSDGTNEYVRSECSLDFQFPNGERKIRENSGSTNGIYFVSVLDSVGRDFFSDSNGDLSAENYSVSVNFYQSCSEADLEGAPELTVSSNVAPVQWLASDVVELPPGFELIGECSITGLTGTIVVQDGGSNPI